MIEEAMEISENYVKKLVFGTGGRFGRLDGKLASALVSYALERGISCFDTGYLYCGGKSQRKLAKCLSECSSRATRHVRLSTKFPVSRYIVPWVYDTLNTFKMLKCIDTLFLWGPSSKAFYDETLISDLIYLKSTGLVSRIGVNTHSLEVLENLLASPYRDKFDCLMLDYSLVRTDRQPYIAILSGLGIEVWAGTALSQGFLVQSTLELLGKSRSASYLLRALFQKETRMLRNDSREVRKILKAEFNEYANGIPLSYVLTSKDITYVPIGMLSRASIDSNIKIAMRPVDAEILKKVDERLFGMQGYSGREW